MKVIFVRPLPRTSKALRARLSRCAYVVLSLAVAILPGSNAVALAAGNLDLSFGDGGKVVTDFLQQQEVINALAIQDDGKIVVAGYTSAPALGSPGDFLIARYNADGSLDASFGLSAGGGGKVTTDFFERNDQARAVAIQDDGKIVVAGYASFRGANDDTEFAFALARYNANGSLDSSFGTAGKVTTDLAGDGGNTYPTPETINALAIQGDGRIVATGTAHAGEFTDFATVRYNADGSLDATFGAGGKVLTDLSGAADFPVANDFANSLAITSDGKIVVAGRVSKNGADFGVVRYNADGSLDASFGMNGDGKVLPDSQSRLRTPSALALASDGKLILAGTATVNNRDAFALLRFTGDGALDSSFGVEGMATAEFNGASAAARALAFESGGKIIAAGSAARDNEAADFALARFNADGNLDTSFGDGGTVTTDFSGGADDANDVVVQSDGKVVAAGITTNEAGNTDIALARYTADDETPGIRYDFCIQDATNLHYLEVNTETGDYLLTRCDEFWLRGKASLKAEGNLLTLTDESSGRSVQVSVNLRKRKASAVVRTPDRKKPTKINDKNIDNNTCSCK